MKALKILLETIINNCPMSLLTKSKACKCAKEKCLSTSMDTYLETDL